MEGLHFLVEMVWLAKIKIGLQIIEMRGPFDWSTRQDIMSPSL
jgi:hypothetical protein